MLRPTIIIEGNLGKLGELRSFGDNNHVINFSLAHTPRSLNKETNQWEDGVTLWKNVTLWGKEALNFANSGIVPGTPLVVIGVERSEEYTVADSSEVRTSIKVTADSVSVPFTRFSYPVNTKVDNGNYMRPTQAAPVAQAAQATQAAPSAQATVESPTFDSVFNDSDADEFDSIFD